MTIQDLGSIGELIAAIATIATLLYLALQLREHTTAIRGEARRAHRSASTAANLAIGTDPAVSTLFNAGLEDFDALTQDQKTQFSFLMGAFVSVFSSAYDEIESGVLPSNHAHQLNGIGKLIQTPGGRKWWAAFRGNYSAGFQEYINDSYFQSSDSSAA